MLTPEENELISRVGPGTAMGNVMRAYWLPALLSSELPERDGAPLRVRLLGEDLVAFRDSQGQVGLIEANCPHRGASLFFGRNEESGLRCVYHGWKFDVTGACVDMPSEPAESNFKHKVKSTAYPCVERNGVVWTYMGTADPPGLPEFEWSWLPAEQRQISNRVQECNWLQALEGGLDSSHSYFLHSSSERQQELARAATGPRAYLSVQKHCHYESVATPGGMLLGARRDAMDGSYYWRISHFLLPFYNMFPPLLSTDGSNGSLGGLGWVPIDDDACMVWGFTWNPFRPLTDAERPSLTGDRRPQSGSSGIHAAPDDLLPPSSAPGGAWRAKANRSNDYFIDRELQRTKVYTGITGLWTQDVAVQESMGPIVDRSREHLGTVDGGIIAARQLALRAARALQDQGTPPPGCDTPEAFRVRPAAIVLPREVVWTEGAAEWLRAQAPQQATA
jgi:phthalate 4,5-dioxygenase